MRTTCPHCKSISSIANDQAGSRFRCAACQELATAPPSRFAPGVVIDDFVIEAEIGAGGMALVFRARQLSLDREVALKILREPVSSDADDGRLAEFIDEARATACLSHPNIIQAYAVGEEDGVHFIAIEYVEGVSLQQLLDKHKRLSLERAANIIMQIAEGLDFAWSKRRLVHMDVTPDNILVSRDGVAKLTDLGVARLQTPNRQEEDAGDEFVGTPGYLAPEVILGQPVDNRTDLYGLGATFYHALTGGRAFSGDSDVEIAAKHLQEQPRPAHELNPDIPKSVSAIISKLMARNRDDRFNSGRQVVAALEAALGTCAPSLARTAVDASAARVDRWECSVCRTPNPQNNDYCVNCGAFGYENCPACEENMRPGSRFCPHCGADIEAALNELCARVRISLDLLVDREHTADDGETAKAYRELQTFTAMSLPDDLREECARALSAFRVDLEETLFEAVVERDIQKVDAAIQGLNAAFDGDVSPHALAVITSFKREQRSLKEGLSHAKIALDRQCLSRCLSVLDSTPPWTGGLLGSRRDQLTRQCRERLQERDRCLADTWAAAQEGLLEDALTLLEQLETFQFSDRIHMLHPDEADLEFQECLGDIRERLLTELREVALGWVNADDWDSLKAMLKALESSRIPCAADAIQELRRAASREVAERYQRAAEAERNGDLMKAADAWEHFGHVPRTFVRQSRRDVAADFPARRREYAAQHTVQLIDGIFALFMVGWFLTIVPTAASLLEALFCDLSLLEAAVHAHFPFFGIFLVVFAAERLAKMVVWRSGGHASTALARPTSDGIDSSPEQSLTAR